MSKVDQMTVLDTVDDSYAIRRASSSGFQYRITVPSRLVETVGFGPSERLGFVPRVRPNGQLDMLYAPFESFPAAQMPLSLTQTEYSGVVRIPSAFGTAVDAASGSVEWSAVELSNGVAAVLAQSTLTVEQVVDDPEPMDDGRPFDAVLLDRAGIDNQRQSNVGYGEPGASWDQEQFRYYLTENSIEGLGWEMEQPVGIHVERVGDQLVLVADPTTHDAVQSPLQKRVNPTSSGARTGLLYFPNDIVRSLGFAGPYADDETEEVLLWLSHMNRLVVMPAATNTNNNATR